MLDSFCPIPKCLSTHLSYHRFLVIELLIVPSQLRLRPTNHKDMRQHFQRSYILASCLGTDGRIGAWGLKPPLLNHATLFANILGSGLDHVDGVKVVFQGPTFRLS